MSQTAKKLFCWQGKTTESNSEAPAFDMGAFERRTTARVQDVVLVQRPAAQAGGIQLVALEHHRPLLPEDEAGTGLVLVAHRHCEDKEESREAKAFSAE